MVLTIEVRNATARRRLGGASEILRCDDCGHPITDGECNCARYYDPPEMVTKFPFPEEFFDSHNEMDSSDDYCQFVEDTQGIHVAADYSHVDNAIEDEPVYYTWENPPVITPPVNHVVTLLKAMGLAFICLVCYALGMAQSHQLRPQAGVYLHQNAKLELVDVWQLDAKGNEIAHWYAFPSDRIDAVMISPEERFKGATE